MPHREFLQRYQEAQDVREIFELVKDSVRFSLNRERSGLMLGLSDLGIAPKGFIGGYHQGGSNAIVLNSAVLKRISSVSPGLLKPYSFSVILHEYLHSLGILDEARTRILTFKVCQDAFGEDHEATKISENFNGVARKLLERGGPEQPRSTDISFVDRFDDEEMGYIG
jgi:hypothetical protein